MVTVPKKTVRKTTKKKTTAKAMPKKAAVPSPAAVPRMAEKGKNPIYVLIIMALVTAIALMVNRYSLRDEGEKDKPKKKPLPVSIETQDRKDDREKREEKETSPDKKEKIEKAQKKERREPSEKKETTDKPAAEEVKVYFVKLNEKSEKMYLAPVARTVRGGPLLENAMKELIRGPTSAEKRKGHLTAVPAGLRVNSVKIRNQSAEIDFNGAIEQGATGSILIHRIDQIVYTATQFPNVKSVVIKINGKQRQTLGTDGLSIGGPLHRR